MHKCIVTINTLWLFLTVPLVGLQCVIVVFPDHTRLLNDEMPLTVLANLGGYEEPYGLVVNPLLTD